MPAPRHLAATALTAGLLVLAACSGSDDNAKPSDDVPSGNTSTTHSTKTTAPPTTNKPPNTPRPTEAGALSTATNGIRAIDHAFATWDVEPLKAVSTSTCRACTDMITTLPLRHRQGYSMTGGRITITGQARVAAGVVRNKKVLVTVPISVSKLTTRNKNGTIYQNDNDAVGSGSGVPAGVADLDLEWTSGAWKITSFGITT